MEGGNAVVAWRLNPALTNFRSAVNDKFPNRDKASDGTIGDPAHQATDSDHNPDPNGSVDAWDMDTDLRSKNDASEIENLKRVFENHPSSRYWIHNGQSASRSNEWKRITYTGKNPHKSHIHWNTREGFENSTAPWVLDEELDMAVTAQDVATSVWDDQAREYVDENGNTVRDTRTRSDILHAAHANAIYAKRAAEAALAVAKTNEEKLNEILTLLKTPTEA
jgi:hypothetical protein